MGVFREKITLNKPRKNEEQLPKNVKLDRITDEDILVVEIVIDSKKDIVRKYKFNPGELSGRKNISFVVKAEDVYWLQGLDPKPMLRDRYQDAPVREFVEEKPKITRKRKPVEKMVLFFCQNQEMAGICASVEVASRLTGILPEAIAKMCRSKKPSRDTGLSFRYYQKSYDISLGDFDITLSQYDELGKRK
ncbi:hypothetical protein LJC45_03555 [Alistipes sp. OttesenSCG-928-B03]|nr:hypothetical protein [Alistipes sp. OttesenSCG-928-B03]